MSLLSPRVLIVDATMLRADTRFTGQLEPLSQQVARVSEAAQLTPERLAIGDATAEEVEAAYERADAIVVMGGEDVTPSLYGMGTDYPESGTHLREADERSCELIRRAISDGIPLLGICRGLQLLNVACGGTLVQHLENSDAHRYLPPRDGDFIRHPVDIDAGSLLAQYLGEHLEAVESAHHQVVAEPGQGLRVSAHAEDGTPEGLEHVSAPVFAVQWHPESESSEPSQLPALLTGLRAEVRERA
ncbi:MULTISPECIES: gamma-glutamyl-gamma-aminobutyrate hydrolase family protein [Gulosibacter]|uniref:gamma-glutamyl-gamma-aminobutyrate hydrolase family protein n=1 Tax=Gulosibacter TaxID=256818 RepID=UPI000F631D81|nr:MULTISPECIES: gamma-glutamyl-gamma-aminobutyrate hydrolase family protein [Gulosibacter]